LPWRTHLSQADAREARRSRRRMQEERAGSNTAMVAIDVQQPPG
jgi:hypothetical protein